ncbi:MAG: transposase [Pseudomonadota bacterium]|uniref:Transposase n=1 Tax=Alcanivorax profundi TaxID=2338368 RepID=A0A418XZM1_9GAMM|nr:transposase [Alcanivorax profundi]MED5240166.1 transposase [Pseudomonadota bacterium]MEE3321320.1 transposase [Pseudomonadota bacterium]RJG18451.1 transposase [Alcanivorax profundi]
MTRARYSQVSLDSTSYYHCICRCVRRAFLCGQDHYSGQDYEHRRQWVVDRLAVLGEVFAIDLCAYAVMSNHYHVVLRINQKKALSWSDQEVAERWMQLFNGPLIVKRWLKGETEAAENLKAEEIVQTWRERLYDLGWFMKCLNEYLARKANEEDCCKGRFWESRYKCQALLDEKAVLQCMAYVDLNPVRADMAHTPEGSDYTSIQQRSEAIRSEVGDKQKPNLLPLVDENTIETTHEDTVCRFRLMDYLELVDSTGRAVRDDKRGAISAHAAGVLDRLGIDEKAWLAHMKPKQQRKPIALGALDKLKEYAQMTGRKWIAGQSLAGW